MKPFRTYVSEAEEAEAPKGTYAKLTLDLSSTKRLEQFCKEQGIDSIPGKDYHCTIVFSRKAVPEIADYPVHLPVSAHVTGYTIFPTSSAEDENQQSLVLTLESKYLQQIFKTFMDDYGAESDYDEFIPHITLTYNWQGVKVPEELPHFNITFSEFIVEELNLDYVKDKGF